MTPIRSSTDCRAGRPSSKMRAITTMSPYRSMRRCIVSMNVAPQRFHCRTNGRLLADDKREAV
jgi:hypothetical protein